VRREANERVETVRDTVRETKVDVDKGAGRPSLPMQGSTPAAPTAISKKAKRLGAVSWRPPPQHTGVRCHMGAP